jgi:hypothetical protein
MAKGNSWKSTNGSDLDFEAQLWAAAKKMRGHADASEYKRVFLGLVFLKYSSDIYDATGAINRENPTLQGVLLGDYARPSLDTAMRGEVNPIYKSLWRHFRGAERRVRLTWLLPKKFAPDPVLLKRNAQKWPAREGVASP